MIIANRLSIFHNQEKIIKKAMFFLEKNDQKSSFFFFLEKNEFKSKILEFP